MSEIEELRSEIRKLKSNFNALVKILLNADLSVEVEYDRSTTLAEYDRSTTLALRNLVGDLNVTRSADAH